MQEWRAELWNCYAQWKEIIANYPSIGLTLRRRPLVLLRDWFTKMNLSTAEELQTFPDRKLARTTGIVTVRQRPGTPNGVLFLSLEDETGVTQVIIWPNLLEKQKREILNSTLLPVYGVWRQVGENTNLIAKRVVDHTELLCALASIRSRVFHCFNDQTCVAQNVW